MRIKAYTYEADIHCIECAEENFEDLENAIDREGNEVRPIFSTDEIDLNMCRCGTCRTSLEE